MTRAILLALLLASCGPRAHIEDTGTGLAATVTDPLGGGVEHHLAEWREIWAHSHYTRVDGPCVSACAFFALVRERDCYTPRASLSIHPAGIAGMVPTEGTRRLTASLVRNWPLELQAWWDRAQPGALGVTLGIEDLRAIMPGRECEGRG